MKWSSRPGLTVLLLGAVAVTTFGLSASASAQTSCEILIAEAEQRYEDGRLQDAVAPLEDCLRTRPSRQVRAEVHALLAKIHLANDALPRARREVEALLELDPQHTPDVVRDPLRFRRLVEEIKRESAVPTVSSVSKSDEPLREAPATVVVITAEEIARRGYTDLEQVFHDLPGFDISRAAGSPYTTLYQRGLRSDTTNRTLFLVDGVEENSLFSGTASISRQYPLSDIDRIEVIYGPASTMYGANAFAGAINILTKDPLEWLENDDNHGAAFEVASGTFDTNFAEATFAGRALQGSLSWSVTGRTFRSDEADRSSFEEWDYDPGFFARESNLAIYHSLLSFSTTPQDPRSATQLIADTCATAGVVDTACVARFQASPLLEIGDETIRLSEEGLRQVVLLDQAAYLTPFQGNPVEFANATDDWLVRGKLRAGGFELGVQSWRQDEGLIGSYTDLFLPGTDNGANWITKRTWLYAKYTRPFPSRHLTLNFFSRFKREELDGQSFFPVLGAYLLGGRSLRDLVEGRPATWQGLYYHTSSNQLRNELSLVFKPSRKLNLVSGLELRSSSTPANFIISARRDPESTGVPASQIPGGNQISTEELGLYAQASFKPWIDRDDSPLRDLKLVFGGRFDRKEIRSKSNGDVIFNPRLAVIYPWNDFVFKASYAEAFQEPTNFQRFVSSPNAQDPAEDLLEEKAGNTEINASWQPSEQLAVSLAAYRSSYSSIVELRVNPETGFLKQQNTGSLTIQGLQVDASYSSETFRFWANYTYTDPKNDNPTGIDGGPLFDERGERIRDLRIGDIASDQVNLGLGAVFWKRLDLDLRLNWVGAKPTGSETTVTSNPLSRFDSYSLVHLTLTWKELLRKTHVSLTVNNLFDESYFHPGVRSADGVVFATRQPQPGRSIVLRVSTSVSF